MRPLIPALAVAMVIAAAIAWAPLPGGQDRDPGGGPSGAAPADPPARITASPATAYIQFTPLSAGAGGAATAPKPGPPVLVGLGGAGRSRTAYIVANGAAVRAQVGDKVGAWRLAAIGPHSVTLRSGGRSMSLAFYGPRAEPPPAAPPGAADSAPAAAPAAAAPAAPPPVSHAPEPASAPPPRGAGGRRYWVGPPGSAPPGYIVLKPGQLPPQ